MSGLAWTYKTWSGRFPSFGCDEFYRRTLVLPNPFRANEIGEDGTQYRSAVSVVIAPWWLTRKVFNAEFRETARSERHVAMIDSRNLQVEIEAAPPTEE